MHKLSDSISTVKGVGTFYGCKLRTTGFYKIQDLRYINEFWLGRFNSFPAKVINSLIECAAIYCANETAIKRCKANIKKYKTFKYYLTHESAFCLLAKRKPINRNGR